MNHDKKAMHNLCAQTFDDDGQSPKFDKKRTPITDNRKDLQLCKQIRRALDSHLSAAPWASASGLRIEHVEPDPDATRVKVRVSWTPRACSLQLLLNLLASKRAELRWAAAAAITRKRAPQLTFEATPHQEGGATLE